MVVILAPDYRKKTSDIQSLPTIYVSMPVIRPKKEVSEYEQHQHYECIVVEEEFLLRRSALNILGILFRSITGDKESKNHFLELLKHVALSEPHDIKNWVCTRGENDTQKKVILAERSDMESFRLRLEAIRQLELCLHAPFNDLPHTHGSVPNILKILCDTAIYYSTHDTNAQTDSVHNMHGLGEFRRFMLTLAAIIPLARLSCARNGQGIFISRKTVTCIVPGDILSVISAGEWHRHVSSTVGNATLPILSEEQDFSANRDDIAPFVFMQQRHIRQESLLSEPSKPMGRRDNNRGNHGKEGTTIDIGPVAKAIKHVLHLSYKKCIGDVNDSPYLDGVISSTSLSVLPSIIRIICYGAISSFISHGMSCPSLDDDLLWLDSDSHSTDIFNENELMTRSRSIAVYAGVFGDFLSTNLGDNNGNMPLRRKVFEELVKLSMSKYQNVVENACRGLVSILSSFRYHLGSSAMNDSATSECLVSFIDYSCSVLMREGSGLMLIPLVHGTCVYYFFKNMNLCEKVRDTIKLIPMFPYGFLIDSFSCSNVGGF